MADEKHTTAPVARHRCAGCQLRDIRIRALTAARDELLARLERAERAIPDLAERLWRWEQEQKRKGD